MYSPIVIERRRQAVLKHLGWLPERSSPDKIAYLKKTIETITKYDEKGNPLGFTETPPDWLLRMRDNEILMCKLDFLYWAQNYAYIRNSSEEIILFPPNRAQKIMLSVWADLEEKGFAIYIINLKARQLGMCLDPKTLVLTSDMQWVPIDSIQVGQELVGTDEEGGGQGHARKLRRSVVEAKREIMEEAFKITFHDGREIIATGQHKFLTTRAASPSHRISEWRQVSDLRPGMAIRNITKTWTTGGTYEDGWFGGMLDGEGSLRQKARAGSECCVAQVEGPVLARAEKYLASNGYTYRRDIDNRKAGESSKLGDKPVVKLVIGRIDEIFKLMGQTRPSRFADRDWWVGKELPGKGPRRIEGEQVCWSTVVSIEPVGRRRMIDLQTSTKTFIAEGLVSHNSSLIELAIAHRIQFYDTVKAVVASSDPRKSERMADMLFLCLAHQPWWLMPAQETGRRGEYAKFTHGPDTYSEIYIEHGSRGSGIARGTTPSVVHLSELPDWEHPKELIDSALMRAIHPDPWKFIILESTAKGLNNWWYYKWQSSQKWPAAKFRPVFLPWFTDEYYWPTPTWLRQNPIPKGWTPKPETLLHAAKAAEAVAATPLLREHFPEGWTLPLHQQWFYENDKEEHIKEDQLAEFLSEMPANDAEAFQSSARSIFSAEVLDFHQSQTTAPVAAYGFVSRLIPVHLQPSALDIDYSYEDDPTAPRPVKIDIRGADEPNTWFTVTLVPLIKDHLLSSSMTLDDEAPFGKLLVYEFPRKWAVYGFGVDTAEGIGQDRTVIEGYRKGVLGASRNAQTCEFASPYINSIDLVPILMAIATWYSPIVDGEMQQAKVVIECAGNGESTQLEMKKRGWSNFHDWLRYDNKITRRSSARKIGWMTRGWSRSLMLDYLIKALKDDWLSISSPWFVKEMRSLGKEDNATKTEAISGAWDDRIMAMAMINLSMWDLELYSGPLDTRMKEVREPLKTYPLLSIPRPTGQRYDSPGDYLSGETDWTAPEDEDQGAYAYD